MIARGFKPVGWVAAVAASALGCYMLSLNVASERAELADVERQIIAARQEIRSLQTELGTRGRLTQLEQWNAEVLALSAPNSRQFIESEFTLASFTQPPQKLDTAKVRMASAETVQRPSKLESDNGFAAPRPVQPLVRQASLVTGGAATVEKALPRPDLVPAAALRLTEPKPAPVKAAAPKAAPAKKAISSTALIDDTVLDDISDAARAEKKSGGAGAQ